MRLLNRCPRHRTLLTLWTVQIRSMGAKPMPVIHCRACATERVLDRMLQSIEAESKEVNEGAAIDWADTDAHHQYTLYGSSGEAPWTAEF